ncbi:MAG: response regulator [Gemmatimonadales bacterium]
MTTETHGGKRGHILLADDEETFRLSTADLLKREGFECDTAVDGVEAMARVHSTPYDLLVSDLKMKGNEELELIRDIAEQGHGPPVIIVTAYPSVRSSIAAIDLAVSAYLVKPVDFPVLLARSEAAITRFRQTHPGQRADRDLREWADDLEAVAERTSGEAAPSAQAFLELSLQNIVRSLRDIEQLGRSLSRTEAQAAHACQLLNCPRGLQLREAVRQTVRVLEDTKSSFRSKALGTLRRHLELLLDVN